MNCDCCSFYRVAKQDFFKNWCEKTGDLVFTSRGNCEVFKRREVCVVLPGIDLSEKPEAVRLRQQYINKPKLVENPSGVSGLSRDQVHEVFQAWAKQDPLDVKSFDDLLEKKRWVNK